MDYIIRKLFYGGGTRRLKRYFHVVYGGARRTYGGAGRNSLTVIMKVPTINPSKI